MERTASGRPTAATAAEGRMAIAIISRSFLLVLENLIRLGDLLEILLGVLVTRILIRVVLHSHLSIGLLQFVLSRLPAYS